ncbi:hypothetical protein AGMMS50256_35990 [Betaproteobacteria bacterium]|nr:hypothetical protein AGMMS50256_35990 [Betaproteobacteria bacterium]
MSRSPSAGSLPELFDDTLRHLESASPKDSPQDGFLFSGNRHESVPRTLFFDRRLTPLERNAWQVIKLQLSQDVLTALSTYEQLRPFLASMPCGAKASHETVARALTMLRLTRWLSLVRRRRNPKTGRIQGNLYVLHDEPLTPFEAMQLDPEYLGLLSQALTHASQSIRRVGCQVLRELGEDPLLAGRILPSRLQVLTQRLIQGGSIPETYPQAEAIHDSEEGAKTLLRNDEGPSSESEAGVKPAPETFLRNPKQDSTVDGRQSNRTIRTRQSRSRPSAFDANTRHSPRHNTSTAFHSPIPWV